MTTKLALDGTDRHILKLLSGDGRSSYQAIADTVGLSRPAVMERVKRLEEHGYITGYGAHIDRAKLGFPVTAFVAVRYGSTNYVGGEPRVTPPAAAPTPSAQSAGSRPPFSPPCVREAQPTGARSRGCGRWQSTPA